MMPPSRLARPHPISSQAFLSYNLTYRPARLSLLERKDDNLKSYRFAVLRVAGKNYLIMKLY